LPTQPQTTAPELAPSNPVVSNQKSKTEPRLPIAFARMVHLPDILTFFDYYEVDEGRTP